MLTIMNLKMVKTGRQTTLQKCGKITCQASRTLTSTVTRTDGVFSYQTSKDKNIENNFNDAQTAWSTIVNGHWLRLRLRFDGLLLGKICRLN